MKKMPTTPSDLPCFLTAKDSQAEGDPAAKSAHPDITGNETVPETESETESDSDVLIQFDASEKDEEMTKAQAIRLLVVNNHFDILAIKNRLKRMEKMLQDINSALHGGMAAIWDELREIKAEIKASQIGTWYKSFLSFFFCLLTTLFRSIQ